MLLGAIYEQDFHGFSHGFREGHSQHQALRELREQCVNMNIGWILDADVSGFFDNLDRGLLRLWMQAAGHRRKESLWMWMATVCLMRWRRTLV
jgi:retron-type reverse transcriptase